MLLVLKVKVKKVKVGFFYSATYAVMPQPASLYNHRKWQLIGKSQWCGSAMLQLQHTPPPLSTTPGLHPVSIHTDVAARARKQNIRLQLTTQFINLERMNGWVDLGGWLHTEIKCHLRESNPDTSHVTHPSTNRARCRVTSLIRPMPLPLRHTISGPQ